MPDAETSQGPKKRGPKPFKPTKAQQDKVALLKAAGFGEPAIATVIGVCQETLRKHFGDELANGRAAKIAENLTRLEKAAKKGNVTAQKYLDMKLNGPTATTRTEALGKKQTEIAEAHVTADAGGKFAPPEPPKLVVNNR